MFTHGTQQLDAAAHVVVVILQGIGDRLHARKVDHGLHRLLHQQRLQCNRIAHIVFSTYRLLTGDLLDAFEHPNLAV